MKNKILLIIFALLSLVLNGQNKTTIIKANGLKPVGLTTTSNGNIEITYNNLPKLAQYASKKKHRTKRYLLDANSLEELSFIEGSYLLSISNQTFDGLTFIHQDDPKHFNFKSKIFLRTGYEDRNIIYPTRNYTGAIGITDYLMTSNGHGEIETSRHNIRKGKFRFWNWEGEIITEKDLEIPKGLEFRPYLLSKDKESFTIYGSKKDEESTMKEHLLFTYDYKGILLNQLKIQTTFKENYTLLRSHIIKSSADEGFYIIAKVISKDKIKTEFFIRKLDKKGIAIWEQYYQPLDEKKSKNSPLGWFDIVEFGDKILVTSSFTESKYTKMFSIDKNSGTIIDSKGGFFKTEKGHETTGDYLNSALYSRKGQKIKLDSYSLLLNILYPNTFTNEFLNTEKFKIKSISSNGNLIILKYNRKNGDTEISLYKNIE